MTEWKEYTGSDEQIAEISHCKTNILLMYSNGTERFKSSMFIGDWRNKYLTHYLICQPHQLADMICQQARTGQRVYIKVTEFSNAINNYEFVAAYSNHSVYVTDKPDWNIPGAEYRFTPFEK